MPVVITRPKGIPEPVKGWDRFLVSKKNSKPYRIVKYNPKTCVAILEGDKCSFPSKITSMVFDGYTVEVRKAKGSQEKSKKG